MQTATPLDARRARKRLPGRTTVEAAAGCIDSARDGREFINLIG